MQSFTLPIPLSLYIHIPWCVRKCPYCDFNSHAVQQDVPEAAYIDALLMDLENELPRIWGRSVQSIFIGGGTPSLFSAAAITRLLSGVRSCLTVAPQAEITLEANPGTVEQQRFAGFRAAGVNRLSLGIQSLQDTQLQALGRIHSSAQAIQALRQARSVGFDNINLDLMFGLPQQDKAQALADLHAVIALQPQHISWYQLTLEPNTAFHAKPPPLPLDDLCAEMQVEGQALLADAGFDQYEISAYSTPGYTCRHNTNYWLFGDYIGLGAGAHGKLTDMATQQVVRRVKWRHPKTYLSAVTSRDFTAEQSVVDTAELPFEFMLNALRLHQRVALELFTQRTGLSFASLLPALHAARERGLVECDAEDFWLTAQGHLFYNDVVALFL